MMCCCDLNPRVVPSPEAERWSKYMKIVAVLHLVLGLMYFFCGDSGIMTGITELISAWILFMAFRTLDYCTTSIYIWFIIIGLMGKLVIVGGIIQFADKFFTKDKGLKIYYVVVSSIAFILYCFALYVAYRAYKEFKALALGLQFGGGNIPSVIATSI